MGNPSVVLGDVCADALQALRQRAPLVHCLTNIVAAQWTANVLLAAGALAWRTEIARKLLAQSPTVVRGNASEVIALTGGSGGKGVEAIHTPEAALGPARELAGLHATVVAVSGPVDHLTDGDRVVRVGNGDVLLTRVTGVGCALGALMAGYAAVVDDPLVAAVSATAHLTVCADSAAGRSSGPGSFAVALLDELASLTPGELVASVQLT